MDPVDGHSARTFETPPNGVRHGRAIEMGSFDGVQGDVGPNDESLSVMEIEGDGILKSVNDRSVFLLEKRHLSNVDPIGKDQTDRLAQGFARRLVGTQDVAVDAAATESAHRIGAQLTAIRFCGAFIDVNAVDSVAGQPEATAASTSPRSWKKYNKIQDKTNMEFAF